LRRGSPLAAASGGPRSELGDALAGQAEQLGGISHRHVGGSERVDGLFLGGGVVMFGRLPPCSGYYELADRPSEIGWQVVGPTGGCVPASGSTDTPARESTGPGRLFELVTSR
jgi:hypothetical protein